MTEDVGDASPGTLESSHAVRTPSDTQDIVLTCGNDSGATPPKSSTALHHAYTPSNQHKLLYNDFAVDIDYIDRPV